MFDIRQTRIAKGIAILLLFWHHLFFNSDNIQNLFTPLFKIGGMSVESIIASGCKVCVAIFLFLSGYGLHKSYERFSAKKRVGNKSWIDTVNYVKKHIIKLLSEYWFIFVIFVPLSLFFGTSLFVVYQYNLFYGIADFFGVSYLLFDFGFGTMNDTWWFMSLILVYYLFFPLIEKINSYCSEILLFLSLFCLVISNFWDFRQMLLWIAPFCLGIYFASNDIFKLIDKKINSKSKIFLFCFLTLSISAFIRLKYFGVRFDAFFGISIILCGYLIFSKIKFISAFFEEMGKYSSFMFMFHTFIFKYYFTDFIYWFKYSPIIFIVMVIICYIVARLLEWLMKVTRYNLLIGKLINAKN